MFTPKYHNVTATDVCGQIGYYKTPELTQKYNACVASFNAQNKSNTIKNIQQAGQNSTIVQQTIAETNAQIAAEALRRKQLNIVAITGGSILLIGLIIVVVRFKNKKKAAL